MKFSPKEQKEIKNRYEKLIEDFTNNIPKKLTAMRKGADDNNKGYKGPLSQTDMAELMGMILQNYTKMEVGKNSKWGIGVKVEHLIKMCVIFNCSADYLLFGKQPAEDMSETIKELRASLETERKLNAALEKELKKKK